VVTPLGCLREKEKILGIMMKASIFCLFLFCFIIPLHAKYDLKPDTLLKKLAFGSCNKHNLPNLLWSEISKYDPQLWMWLGDIVYADSVWRSGILTLTTSITTSQATTHDLRERFAIQKNATGYKSLIQKTPVIGVWVTHYNATSLQIRMIMISEKIMVEKNILQDGNLNAFSSTLSTNHKTVLAGTKKVQEFSQNFLKN
jgi:hypothetical protein